MFCVFVCMHESDTLLFDMYFALWPLGGDRFDFVNSRTQTCNKHASDNEGARWAIEGAIAIVYVVFTTVLQRQCRYLLTLLYTNKDRVLINPDSRLHRVDSQVILHSSRFTSVHVNTHDGPCTARDVLILSLSLLFALEHPP